MEHIRVLLVNGLPAFRAGLRTMLAKTGDIEVVGEAIDSLDAFEEVSKRHPGIVLICLGLDDPDCLDFVRRTKRCYQGISVILLGTSAGDAFVTAFAEAGCSAYLRKSVSQDLLIHTIRAVSSGGLVVEAGLGEAASRFFAGVSSAAPRTPEGPEKAAITGQSIDQPLTPREREVLVLLVQGYTNKLIGEALQISDETAKQHVRSIIAKLGACDRTQAAVLAVRGGMTR